MMMMILMMIMMNMTIMMMTNIITVVKSIFINFSLHVRSVNLYKNSNGDRNIAFGYWWNAHIGKE